MFENFQSFVAVFTLSCVTRPFTLILHNKTSELKVIRNYTSKYFQQIFWMLKLFGMDNPIVKFIIARVCSTPTGWHVCSCSNIREHLEQWQVNVNVIHNYVFQKHKQKGTNVFYVFINIFMCAIGVALVLFVLP